MHIAGGEQSPFHVCDPQRRPGEWEGGRKFALTTNRDRRLTASGGVDSASLSRYMGAHCGVGKKVKPPNDIS
jgi:hypothetical protein